MCAHVCPRGVLKLENGEPGDRFEGAETPVSAFLASRGLPDRNWTGDEQPERWS